MKNQKLVYSPVLAEPLFKSLRIQYNVFLVSLILITLFLSRRYIPFPQISEDILIQIKSISVLMTMGLIPFALWLFGKRRDALIQKSDWDSKKKGYFRLSAIRLFLIWLVVALNVAFYFVTDSYSELLCAGMGVTASLFCIPSLKKIEADLFDPAETTESCDNE
ncbi:MAG: hypothetical protein ACRCSQ_02315 [Bacteroidales bacterium]